jgi:vacuolar-type H+-ATPase subunit E/Vma4
MGLERLQAEIDAQARTQAAAARAQTDEAVNAIESDARQKAATQIENARTAAAKESEGKVGEVYAAKLAAKKLLSEAMQAAVTRAFSDVRGELARVADSPEYPAILERLVKKALKEMPGEAVLHGRKADTALLSKYGKVGHPIDTIGGVRVTRHDGKLALNATFEALIESNAEDIQARAFKELFGSSSKIQLDLPVQTGPTGSLETASTGAMTVEKKETDAMTRRFKLGLKPSAKPKTAAKKTKPAPKPAKTAAVKSKSKPAPSKRPVIASTIKRH